MVSFLRLIALSRLLVAFRFGHFTRQLKSFVQNILFYGGCFALICKVMWLTMSLFRYSFVWHLQFIINNVLSGHLLFHGHCWGFKAVWLIEHIRIRGFIGWGISKSYGIIRNKLFVNPKQNGYLKTLMGLLWGNWGKGQGASALQEREWALSLYSRTLVLSPLTLSP